MSLVSITTAAKLTRVSRATIYNKIENGQLSKGPDGIDTSELLRVFGQLYDVNDVQPTASNVDVSASQRQVASATVDILQSRLDAADKSAEWFREQLEQKDAQLLEKDAQLAKQFDRLTALLPAPEAPKRRRFLGIF